MGQKKKHARDPKFPKKFQIPEWFIANRIKTPSDLEKSPERLALYDNTPDTQSQTESGTAQPAENRDEEGSNDWQVHRAPREKFDELVDMGEGILAFDGTAEFWENESTIVLTSMDSESEYSDYLESVAHDMAKRMGVTLITIDTGELEILGWDLYDQETDLWERSDRVFDKGVLGQVTPNRLKDYAMASEYFGGQLRNERREDLVMTAIFDAAREKAIQSESWIRQEGANPPPIMVYLRDCHEILGSMIGHDMHGVGCLKAFTKWVQKLRRTWQRTFLVCAMPGDWADITPSATVDRVKELGWKAALEMRVDPPEAIAVSPASLVVQTRNTNLYRLQCRLRWRCRELIDPQLLNFFFEWPGVTDEEREAIGSRYWEDDDYDRAEIQICGRSQHDQPASLADVWTVLRRIGLLERQYEPEPEPEPEPELEQDLKSEQERNSTKKRKRMRGVELDLDRPPKKARRTDKKSPWDKKLAKLAKSCDEYEVNLLNSLVNPDGLDTSWDDIIVDQYTKDSMMQLVSLSRLRPVASSSFMLKNMRITGALLYGPPGTGKTHLCQAVARASGFNMLKLDSAALMSKWVGDSEKNIRAAFTLAEKLHPCVMLLDEVDAVFYRRSSGDSTWTRRSLVQFLACMDGLARSDAAPFVLAATNRPWELDEAFLRRLPRKVAFGLPDEECRTRILWTLLSPEDLDAGVDVAELARETAGYQGSDLKNVCIEAGHAWEMEQVRAGNLVEGASESEPVRLKLTRAHFVGALRAIRPSNSGVSSQLLDFAKRFNPELPGAIFE